MIIIIVIIIKSFSKSKWLEDQWDLIPRFSCYNASKQLLHFLAESLQR